MKPPQASLREEKMIDFSLAPKTLKAKRLEHNAAEYLRSIARYYDDHEHEELKPEEIKQVRENAEASGICMGRTRPRRRWNAHHDYLE